MENASLSPEISCASTAYDYPPRTPSPTSIPPSGTQSLNTTSPSLSSVAPYLTHPRDVLGSIGNLPFVDGLGVQRVVRAYRMVQRTRKPHPLRQRGELRSKKVELVSVEEAIQKRGCKQNCLRDLDVGVILNKRYSAWGKKYEERATWMLQRLDSSKCRVRGKQDYKFDTKLDGVSVCNVCFVVGMAYSRRKVEQLKKGILAFGRITAIHGNSCTLREKVQVSAARESFDAFVQEAGCPQPLRSIRRRLDDTVHILVLLPMNTTKTDVYEYVIQSCRGFVKEEALAEQDSRNYGGRSTHMFKFHHIHDSQSASTVGNTSAPWRLQQTQQ
jgi:hypothetical protein